MELISGSSILLFASLFALKEYKAYIDIPLTSAAPQYTCSNHLCMTASAPKRLQSTEPACSLPQVCQARAMCLTAAYAETSQREACLKPDIGNTYF